jgi:hypothetical protein
MEYEEGKTGRIFVLRFDHGDDFVSLIHSFVKEKQIKIGYLHVIGAFLASDIVTGPKSRSSTGHPFQKGGRSWDSGRSCGRTGNRGYTCMQASARGRIPCWAA